MNWNELHIGQLVTLDPLGSGRWRSRHSDANQNGRSYGGQLLAQAMMAALNEVPGEREPAMMQFLFLQGAVPGEAIEFNVTTLQEGKRFSSRRVSGKQANGRTVLDAQVMCGLGLDSPEHGVLSPAPAGEKPESLPSLGDVPAELFDKITRLGGYGHGPKPSIELRIPNPVEQLSARTGNPRFRYWIRAAHPLPDDRRVQAAAFAFLSDWWLSFSAYGVHLGNRAPRKFYATSMNQAMWFHRRVRPDQWLHVDSVSPAAGGGLGLAVARFHDEAGRMVATVSQQVLMAFAD